MGIEKQAERRRTKRDQEKGVEKIGEKKIAREIVTRFTERYR